MKISNLQIYGIETQTFKFSIDNYDTNTSDEEIKNSIKTILYNVSQMLGYNTENVNIDTDIQFITYNRYDDENFIICVCNILKLL